MNYTKTTWENDITPVSAENMNKIENQLKALTDAVYPVGSIYISVKSTNPSSFFGGTWTAFGTGRTLVGINTSDTNFDTVEKTGGTATHTLTTTEMPSQSAVVERIIIQVQEEQEVLAQGLIYLNLIMVLVKLGL